MSGETVRNRTVSPCIMPVCRNGRDARKAAMVKNGSKCKSKNAGKHQLAYRQVLLLSNKIIYFLANGGEIWYTECESDSTKIAL